MPFNNSDESLRRVQLSRLKLLGAVSISCFDLLFEVSLISTAFTHSITQGKKFFGGRNWSQLIVFGTQACDTSQPLVLGLHVLELVHSPFRVAFPHLPQGLVLVSALLHILLVDLVHRRLSLDKITKDRRSSNWQF